MGGWEGGIRGPILQALVDPETCCSAPGTTSPSGSKGRPGDQRTSAGPLLTVPPTYLGFFGSRLVVLRPGGLTRSRWPGAASGSLWPLPFAALSISLLAQERKNHSLGRGQDTEALLDVIVLSW